MRFKTIVVLLILGVVLLAGCGPKATPEKPDAGMANPASVHCGEEDGTTEIRKDADGNEVGFCVFSDGSECEEWSFYRGECEPGQAEIGMPNPASVHCEEKGGKLEIRTGEDGGQVGYCIFSDGSECEEWAFFNGECEPENVK